MSGISNLSNMYSCCMCFEPMKSAVSLNPCGHEIDEGCANTIIASKIGCPICRVDVDSFRPAYTTRQAAEALFQNMEHTNITIHVKELSGRKHTYQIRRDSKAIDLCKRIFADTEIHPSRIKLIYNQQLVSLFSRLSEIITSNETEFNFYMTARLGHWKHIAEDYPLIYQKAIAEVGAGSEADLRLRFSFLFEQAIAEAMNSCADSKPN